MSKAFISILGTNDYLETRHKFPDGKVTREPVKYIQEDLVKEFCQDWTEDDEIRIFITDEAEKKNWLDDGHKDKEGNVNKNTGLEKRLNALGLKAKIKPIKIPTGDSEKEIWEIFDIISSKFRKDEKVIVDITHSFRSLPMLLTVMLNYTRQIKNINVEGIYYAAFETLGPIPEVRKIPVKERIAPIFDLTPLVKLQEWTNATRDFIEFANVKELKRMIKSENNSYEKIDEENKLLRKTFRMLDQVSENIALCRGREIVNKKYSVIKNNLKELEKITTIKPVKNLFELIDKKIERFSDSDLNNGFVAVEWCMEHKLYQQAITILQETIITKILYLLNLDYSNLKYRKIVTSAIRFINEGTPEEKWRDEAGEHKEITKKIMDLPFTNEIRKDFDKISSIRNDVNHAGFLSDNRNTDSILARINQVFEKIKEF